MYSFSSLIGMESPVSNFVSLGCRDYVYDNRVVASVFYYRKRLHLLRPNQKIYSLLMGNLSTGIEVEESPLEDKFFIHRGWESVSAEEREKFKLRVFYIDRKSNLIQSVDTGIGFWAGSLGR